MCSFGSLLHVVARGNGALLSHFIAFNAGFGAGLLLSLPSVSTRVVVSELTKPSRTVAEETVTVVPPRRKRSVKNAGRPRRETRADPFMPPPLGNAGLFNPELC